jgi:hypothetical protein
MKMDIVEQLRWCGLGFPKFKTNRGDYGICDDAADEIERLRETLKIFADDVKKTNVGIDKNWAKTVNALKAENQRLREALATINAWYPISVSRPMDTVRDIMDFANKTLNGEKE